MGKKIKKKPKYSINHCSICSYHASEYGGPDCAECEHSGGQNKKKKSQVRKPRRDEYYE